MTTQCVASRPIRPKGAPGSKPPFSLPRRRPGGEPLREVFSDAQKAADRKPVFNERLGLAVEDLAGDLTIERLWSVV